MTEVTREIFETRSIVKMLVRLRLKQACKRHALQFYWEISDNPRRRNPVGSDLSGRHESPSVDELQVSDCLPGRRSWPRPGKTVRNGLTSDGAQERALVAYVMRSLEDEGCTLPWKQNLCRLVDAVIERVEAGELVFRRPRLHLLEKGRDSFRCLATYECLPDRVIISRLAAYLRDVFDSQMRSNSYSFRKDGSVRHLTAIRDLRQYRLAHPGKIFAAECDIQKFFDVLGHGVAQDAFEYFAATCGRTIEPWMRSAVRAYLDSYSSYRNLSEDAGIAEEQKRKVAHFADEGLKKWLKKTYGKKSLETIDVGIPQGGALSPLIINMVMHRADEAVLAAGDPKLFYARYCDDMVIVHPDQKQCKAAFDRYLAMMESLMLPVHSVKRGMRYGKDFYEGKSKGPYAWTDCGQGALRASPWVSFLGEQIRFDGVVRIRQESVGKQALKLKKEQGLLRRAIGKSSVFLKPCLDREEVFERFRSRLAAIGVGYAPREVMGSSGDRCWMAAFSGITNSRWTRVQMSYLDRVRESILNDISRRGCLKPLSSVASGKGASYLGRPYSYRGFLERLERTGRLKFMSGPLAYGEW